MTIDSTIVSVPKITEADAAAAKLSLGPLARFAVIPVIETRGEAVQQGLAVAARRCVEEGLGWVSGVDKVQYDEASNQWDITFAIGQ